MIFELVVAVSILTILLSYIVLDDRNNKAKIRYDTRFEENELFCRKCYCHDGFFIGGGSWTSDYCPFCGGTACSIWKEVPQEKKNFAYNLHKKMWEWSMSGSGGGSNPRSFPTNGRVDGFEQYYKF